VKVTLVGCAGSFPGPDSPASCYLLEHEGTSILLDLGNGALGALQRYTDIYDVDAVVLTHLHADHCLDLASYYVARRFHPDGPRRRIPVHGPAGTAGRMARAYDMAEDPGMSREFAFVDHRAVPVAIGPFTLTTAPMAHPVPCFGLRVEAGGRSVVYSGDTGPTDALVGLARGADLALFEASFLDGDNPPGLHLSARQAAEHARRAGVDHLVLTHLVAWNPVDLTSAQARDAHDGRISLAHSGLVIDLA
jgi:ribonuclease BN (tRNA processing enzyme)